MKTLYLRHRSFRARPLYVAAKPSAPAPAVAEPGPSDPAIRLLRLAVLTENWPLGIRIARVLANNSSALVRIRCAEFHLEYTRVLVSTGQTLRALHELESARAAWAPAGFAVLNDPVLRRLL